MAFRVLTQMIFWAFSHFVNQRALYELSNVRYFERKPGPQDRGNQGLRELQLGAVGRSALTLLAR